MDTSLKEIIWLQFGASLDMLENAMAACPGKVWGNESKFWYTAYHVLFWTDFYLCDDPLNFLPPAPYTLSEFNDEGEMPERMYSKEELLVYLAAVRQKLHDVIAGLNNELPERRFISRTKNYSLAEILLYNMRHMQHHTGQLNMLLRQHEVEPPGWVSQTKMGI